MLLEMLNERNERKIEKCVCVCVCLCWDGGREREGKGGSGGAIWGIASSNEVLVFRLNEIRY